MISKPLISVIMPAYNCSSYIEQSISSILNQTYENIELVICDDCSKDATYEVITKYRYDPRIKIYKNTANLGYLETWNKLLGLASGSIIAQQDADDWSDINRLEEQWLLLSENKFDLVGTDLMRTDQDGNSLYKSEYNNDISTILPFFKRTGVLPLSTNSIMFKKSLIEKTGGYLTYFNRLGAEDYDWFLRAIDKGVSYYCINKPLYFYRTNEFSITSLHKHKPYNRRKYFLNKLLVYLHEERINRGFDCLERGNDEEAEAFVKKCEDELLLNDSSFIIRENIRATICTSGFSLKTSMEIFRVVLSKPINVRIKFQFLKNVLFMDRFPSLVNIVFRIKKMFHN